VYTVERYTIPEVVEKSSRRYAERPALSMVGGKPVLYRDLEPRTRRIAAFLGLLGIKKGDRVAILSENNRYVGAAPHQVDAFVAEVKPLARRYRGVAEYEPGKLL